MRSLAVACLFLLPSVASAELGHSLKPDLGKPAPVDYESVVMTDGTGLPVGRGQASKGESLYTQHCLACHGADGKLQGNAIAGGIGTLTSDRPLKTVGSYWPYATTLFDYISRAMPYGNEKVLTPDELYAITAYVLHLNGIVKSDVELDQDNLADIEMPNRDGFYKASNFESEK